MRILLYAQHLSGAGHYVRARAIAAELASAHEVWLLDGGKPLPLQVPPGVTTLELPRIRRQDDSLTALDTTLSIVDVMQARRANLREAAHRLRPDVVLVEHYPFSKWDLAPEIDALLDEARRAQPAVKVVCSVRDLPLQTRHEACSPAAWGERVVATLHRDFDTLLVHGDESLTPLEASFPAARRLRLPVHHTGIVHDAADGFSTPHPSIELGSQPFVVCSIGGGDDGARLLGSAVAAWEDLKSRGQLPDYRLVLCSGIHCGAHALTAEARTAGIISLPFTPGFSQLLRHCQLSISNAGYNTCADLLTHPVRSILVPNPQMSDQPRRAALMQDIGAARVLSAGALGPQTLATSIRDALSARPPRTNRGPNLSGAGNTRKRIEALLAQATRA